MFCKQLFDACREGTLSASIRCNNGFVGPRRARRLPSAFQKSFKNLGSGAILWVLLSHSSIYWSQKCEKLHNEDERLTQVRNIPLPAHFYFCRPYSHHFQAFKIFLLTQTMDSSVYGELLEEPLHTETQQNILIQVSCFTPPLSVLASSAIVFMILYDGENKLKFVYQRLLLAMSLLDDIGSLTMSMGGVFTSESPPPTWHNFFDAIRKQTTSLLLEYSYHGPNT